MCAVTSPTIPTLLTPATGATETQNPVNFTAKVPDFGVLCGLTSHMNYSLFLGKIYSINNKAKTRKGRLLRLLFSQRRPLYHNFQLMFLLEAFIGQYKRQMDTPHLFLLSETSSFKDVMIPIPMYVKKTLVF